MANTKKRGAASAASTVAKASQHGAAKALETGAGDSAQPPADGVAGAALPPVTDGEQGLDTQDNPLDLDLDSDEDDNNDNLAVPGRIDDSDFLVPPRDVVKDSDNYLEYQLTAGSFTRNENGERKRYAKGDKVSLKKSEAKRLKGSIKRV